MIAQFQLSGAAEADLRSIIRYTRNQWSASQARKYSQALEQGMARLAGGQGNFRSLPEIHPLLRVARCEHHFIFCLDRSDAPALVIAILHERMDLIARLSDRLM